MENKDILSFSSLGLPQPILDALKRINFTLPTPIQAAAIPVALEGKDILGSAQTGTGKSAAFGIPLIAKLIADQTATALVMTPTRELATQMQQTINSLLERSLNIKTALLIGGESMDKQIWDLNSRPRIIVGTPGRINDHLLRGNLTLKNTRFLVLDETDRMLDMGFSDQIAKIVKHIPQDRQTLLFSATMPHDIMTLAEEYLREPVRIAVGQAHIPAENIKQEVLHVTESDKYQHLLTELDKREGSVIIFVKTKYGAERMAVKLREESHNADAIHGDLRHNKRERVIKAFRNKKYRIMVATDVAARGLDIPHIEHVINYDLPQCPEDYIHRIGRTARAGSEGAAVCFVTPSEKSKWIAIDRLMNPDKHVGKPAYSASRSSNFRPKSNRFFGEEKRRSRPDVPGRRFQDKDSDFFGERSFKRNDFDGDSRPPRRSNDFDGDARPPRRDFDGDSRPPRRSFDNKFGSKFEGDRSSAPFKKRFSDDGAGEFKKPFHRADKPQFGFGGENSEIRKSSFGGDRREGGFDRPRRFSNDKPGFGQDKKPFGPSRFKKPFAKKPRSSFGEFTD